MTFLIILGTCLRLIFIDKPDGLWNDEYVSWSIASIPLGKGFIDAFLAQCHMPFYYLYLKFFIHFGGNSDLLLRLTSVLAGVLSILVMYFVGKEFKDEKLGILCAAVTSLSSFLIYFSQEVRFYQLLFLFSALALVFTIRLSRNQNRSNLIFYLLFNFLIIFTHTIGFVFVFFNLIYLSFILKSQEKFKPLIISIWSVSTILTLINIPIFLRIFSSHPYSQWWGSFSLSKLGFLVTDYFSPILTNIVNSPDNFFYKFSLAFLIFGILPAAIAIAGFVKALSSKNKEITGLFNVCLAFVLVLILLAVTSKLMFITKYSIEIYPILILVMGFGILEFGEKSKKGLIFLFCFLNLFYVLVDSNSAPKMHRSEGHKIVATLLKNADLKKGDLIFLNYYSKERFEKYFDFSNFKVSSVNKNNFWKYLGIKDEQDFGKSNEVLDKNIRAEFNSLKQGQKFVVVVLNDVAIYSPMQIYNVLNQETKKPAFLFLVFSHLKNELMKESLKNLQISRIENKGSWSVITFIKK